MILNDKKMPINEYDSISISLTENKNVQVWIWGVTTELGIKRKRDDDRQKIQKIKDHLFSRWEGIKLIENYVYKDGNNICLEIDGHRFKR